MCTISLPIVNNNLNEINMSKVAEFYADDLNKPWQSRVVHTSYANYRRKKRRNRLDPPIHHG